MSSTLHFPSEHTIANYLEQHPLTKKEKNAYLTEKNIIQTVAKIFADQKKEANSIDGEVLSIMENLNLPLPRPVFLLLKLEVAKALVDCALNNKSSSRDHSFSETFLDLSAKL